jgi:hypothetical protein
LLNDLTNMTLNVFIIGCSVDVANDRGLDLSLGDARHVVANDELGRAVRICSWNRGRIGSNRRGRNKF